MGVSRKIINSSGSRVRIVPKTKKIPLPKTIVSRTGIEISTCYCRKCMKTKKPDDFLEAVDGGYLDANGKMSICKNCCNDIFNKIYDYEKDVDKALLRTCRILNVRYDEVALNALHDHLQSILEMGHESERLFGIYRNKLMNTQKTRITERNMNETFIFEEPVGLTKDPAIDEDEDSHDMIQFWGNNFKQEDFDWLELELADWKKTHKCDTKAEETLLKEICYIEFDMRKARSEGRSPAALVEQLQKVMKTAAVDPSKTALAGSGKSQDTFSAFIKTIEQNEPAEVFEDKQLFKDFDNIDWYFRKYITRPLKNFITQSRDFNVEKDEEEDEFGEVFEDGDIPTTLAQ